MKTWLKRIMVEGVWKRVMIKMRERALERSNLSRRGGFGVRECEGVVRSRIGEWRERVTRGS